MMIYVKLWVNSRIFSFSIKYPQAKNGVFRRISQILLVRSSRNKYLKYILFKKTLIFLFFRQFSWNFVNILKIFYWNIQSVFLWFSFYWNIQSVFLWFFYRMKSVPLFIKSTAFNGMKCQSLFGCFLVDYFLILDLILPNLKFYGMKK